MEDRSVRDDDDDDDDAPPRGARIVFFAFDKKEDLERERKSERTFSFEKKKKSGKIAPTDEKCGKGKKERKKERETRARGEQRDRETEREQSRDDLKKKRRSGDLVLCKRTYLPPFFC